MTAILDSFLPLVVLMGLGWLLRRRGLLGATAARELTAFVVWLALPALLFEGVAAVSWRELWQPRYLATLAAGMAAGFVAGAWPGRGARPAIDRWLDGFGASYANTGFIGVPLCLLVFGAPALIPATISTVLTAVMLFALGIAAIELAAGASAPPWRSLARAGGAVGRNPLVVATLAGMAWSAAGLAMPRAPQRLLELLAGAAAPCALASIGALLAEPAPAARAHPVSAVVVAKLALQPAVCALLAFGVFRLPAPWAQCAVLLSALPTGTGPFMLAEFYGRDAARASRVMFVTTAVSLVTVPACIAVLR